MILICLWVIFGNVVHADINECADDGLHDCSSSDYCINKEGTWACSCPSNFIGNGRRSNGTDGNGCRAKPFPLIYKVLIGMKV